MLTIDKKIQYFENLLLTKDTSYRGTILDEIYFYFFEMQEVDENIESFSFLNLLEGKKEIEKKVDFLVSKIIMNEHHDGIHNLIYEYTLV